MKFRSIKQAVCRLLPSRNRTARPARIALYIPGLCAAICLSTLVLCDPVCSRAVPVAAAVQSVSQSAPAIYIADSSGSLHLVPNAVLSVQEGAVYTDTCILGYLASYDNTIIVDANGSPIGRVVYSAN